MHVLVIDDDAMNRAVVRAMLGVAGAGVDEAASGEAGLAALDGRDYDLILMDLRMPGMDGLEATARIRARADARARTPVVIVTADTAPDLRKRCTAGGADDLISKPIIMDALFSTLGRFTPRLDVSVSP